MTYKPATSIITVGTVTTMVAVSSIDMTFAPGVKGFRIYVYDLEMRDAADAPTLQLEDGGGLQTTGYNSLGWDKAHTSSYTQTELPAAVTSKADTAGLVGAGSPPTSLVYGFWDGTLIDEATNLWQIYGKFRDSNTSELTDVEVMCEVTLDDGCVGAQLASGDGTDWVAGNMGWQSWT